VENRKLMEEIIFLCLSCVVQKVENRKLMQEKEPLYYFPLPFMC
jgi:hypothetical protein